MNRISKEDDHYNKHSVYISRNDVNVINLTLLYRRRVGLTTVLCCLIDVNLKSALNRSCWIFMASYLDADNADDNNKTRR